MAPVQQVPSSPREAILMIRQALEELETQPWVRNYAAATASTNTQGIGPPTAQAIERLALGSASLTTMVVQVATQQQKVSA